MLLLEMTHNPLEGVGFDVAIIGATIFSRQVTLADVGFLCLTIDKDNYFLEHGIHSLPASIQKKSLAFLLAMLGYDLPLNGVFIL